MIQDTNMDSYSLLSAASGQTSHNTYALSYPTACIRATALTAVPLTRWYRVEPGVGKNYFSIMALLKDTEGDLVDSMTALFTLWGLSAGYTGAKRLLVATLTAGSAVIGTAGSPGKSPADNSTLVGQWGHVDTFDISVNNCNAKYYCASDSNGIAEIHGDGMGNMWFYADFDCDGGSNDCDGAMALIRWW